MNETEFITGNFRARGVFIQGYERGYGQGYQDGHGTAQDRAELAALRFMTLEALEAHNRAQATITAQSVDVPRMASKPMPTVTIKPTPTLDQFMAGLRRGGVLGDVQAVRA